MAHETATIELWCDHTMADRWATTHLSLHPCLQHLCDEHREFCNADGSSADASVSCLRTCMRI